MLSRQRLTELLPKFAELKIGLLGDLFLDRYLEIDPELVELSIETGLEAYQVTRIRNSPGALGTVINNLAALGVGRLVPLSVLGDDGQAYDLRQALERLPVEPRFLLQDAERKTPTYTKPLRRDSAGVWHELNRIDLRNRAPLSALVERELLARLDQVFAECDGLIVLDQVNEEGWGVVNPTVRKHLAALQARAPGKLIFVDSRAHIGKFTTGMLKPNQDECLRALEERGAHRPVEPLAAAEAGAGELARRTGQPVFCTLGPQGMLVVDPHRSAVRVPAVPVTGPIDIVGAGDSATSGIVASLLAGATPVEAAAVGNLVASITIQQLGTTGTATPAQVIERWSQWRPVVGGEPD